MQSAQIVGCGGERNGREADQAIYLIESDASLREGLPAGIGSERVDLLPRFEETALLVSLKEVDPRRLVGADVVEDVVVILDDTARNTEAYSKNSGLDGGVDGDSP